MQSGVTCLLGCFTKTAVFCFPQSLQPIKSQFLGYLKSVQYGCYLMEWNLTQIRCWLVTPSRFVPLLFQCVLQGNRSSRLVCSICCCLSFSLNSLRSIFQYCEHQSDDMKVLGRHQRNVSMCNVLCKYCLQQQVPAIILQQVRTISLWRGTIPGHSMIILGRLTWNPFDQKLHQI